MRKMIFIGILMATGTLLICTTGRRICLSWEETAFMTGMMLMTMSLSCARSLPVRLEKDGEESQEQKTPMRTI